MARACDLEGATLFDRVEHAVTAASVSCSPIWLDSDMCWAFDLVDPWETKTS